MRSRQTFDQIHAGDDRRRRAGYLRLIEEAQARVETNRYTNRIVLEGRPVEAAKADEAIGLARGGDIDVITALAIDVVRSTVALEDVVALDRLIAERIEVVAGGAVAGAALDPVIAFIAERELIAFAAE